MKPSLPATATRPKHPTAPPVQRRRHQRLDLRMSAEIRTASAVFTATTRDLSEGGAGLIPERPLKEGEELALGFFLVLDGVETETPPLWVKGRVAWSGESDDGHFTAGVRFLVITDEQRTWLRQILNQMAPSGPV
jgi:c-di-GMP-binding flagellar brake protein YcgR